MGMPQREAFYEGQEQDVLLTDRFCYSPHPEGWDGILRDVVSGH